MCGDREPDDAEDQRCVRISFAAPDPCHGPLPVAPFLSAGAALVNPTARLRPSGIVPSTAHAQTVLPSSANAGNCAVRGQAGDTGRASHPKLMWRVHRSRILTCLPLRIMRAIAMMPGLTTTSTGATSATWKPMRRHLPLGRRSRTCRTTQASGQRPRHGLLRSIAHCTQCVRARRRVELSDLIEDPTEPIYSGGVGISRLECCVLINAVVAKYPSVGKVGSGGAGERVS